MGVQLIKLLKQLPYLNVSHTGLKAGVNEISRKATVNDISRFGVAGRAVSALVALINTGLQPGGGATRPA